MIASRSAGLRLGAREWIPFTGLGLRTISFAIIFSSFEVLGKLRKMHSIVKSKRLLFSKK